jgi:hypothetical protein
LYYHMLLAGALGDLVVTTQTRRLFLSGMVGL